MSAEFKRVYSGGHHDVYCDGVRHFTVDGEACGTCAIGRPDGAIKIRYQFKCDCAKFATSKVEQGRVVRIG